MRKNLLIIFVVLFASKAYGFALFNDLFEGFQDSSEYQSSLPCIADQQKTCSAVHGALGKALDTASEIGLRIQSIIIKSEGKNDNALFVETEKVGTCYVNPNNKTGLKFTCSSNGLVNTRLANIDRIIVLQKDENNQFALQDITGHKAL